MRKQSKKKESQKRNEKEILNKKRWKKKEITQKENKRKKKTIKKRNIYIYIYIYKDGCCWSKERKKERIRIYFKIGRSMKRFVFFKNFLNIFIFWICGPSYFKKYIYIFSMVRVFANGPGDLGSIPGRVILKTQKNGTWCFLA